ncbi:hypothetical protein [Microbispora rosea]
MMREQWRRPQRAAVLAGGEELSGTRADGRWSKHAHPTRTPI